MLLQLLNSFLVMSFVVQVKPWVPAVGEQGGHVPTLEVIWVCISHPEFLSLERVWVTTAHPGFCVKTVLYYDK